MSARGGVSSHIHISNCLPRTCFQDPDDEPLALCITLPPDSNPACRRIQVLLGLIDPHIPKSKREVVSIDMF